MKTKIQTTKYETETREQAFAQHFAPRLIDPVAGIFVEMGEAEKWQCIREVRNGLLGASDWTQAADSPLSAGQREIWRVYRQQLRDLPGAFDDPAAVVWPVEPEV